MSKRGKLKQIFQKFFIKLQFETALSVLTLQPGRKNIIPGNSKSLWTAVNISKDIGSSEIPNNMYCNDKQIPESEVANCVATYFEKKVDKFVKNAKIDPGVYNGTPKLVAADINFLSRMDILECVKQLKINPN